MLNICLLIKLKLLFLEVIFIFSSVTCLKHIPEHQKAIINDIRKLIDIYGSLRNDPCFKDLLLVLFGYNILSYLCYNIPSYFILCFYYIYAFLVYIAMRTELRDFVSSFLYNCSTFNLLIFIITNIEILSLQYNTYFYLYLSPR